MRFRIGLALCLSLILISTTVWFRSHSNKTAPTLVAVDNSAASETNDYTPTSTSDLGTQAPDENLTTTDLVGRQLITDYINLARAGQATDENLASLGNKYADGVSNLQLNSAPIVSLSDLSTVADTKANFKTYDEITTKIDSERVATVNQAYGKGQDLETLSSGIYILAKTIGEAYEGAATKLKGIKVPISLASLHLKLINNYLSS